MKIIVTLLTTATAAMLATGVHAADAKAGETLTRANGCLACHAVDKKLIGPSYKDVADRYRKDNAAEATLVKKVKEGGKGVWGDIPMAPNAHVKDEDIKTMVQWILSIK